MVHILPSLFPVSVRRFQDLDVWKLANELRGKIRQLTKRAAFEQHHWLRLQLRRASNSSCSNTAEGFGRFKPREFAHYLRIAHGALKEIVDHLTEVSDLELAPKADIDEASSLADRAGRAAAALIAYLDSAPEPQRGRRRSHRQQPAETERRKAKPDNGRSFTSRSPSEPDPNAEP